MNLQGVPYLRYEFTGRGVEPLDGQSESNWFSSWGFRQPSSPSGLHKRPWRAACGQMALAKCLEKDRSYVLCGLGYPNTLLAVDQLGRIDKWGLS